MFIHVKSSDSIPISKKILYSGGIIVFPTETVYKVGCHLTNIKAQQKLYIMKENDVNFVILCSSIDSASNIIRWNPLIERLAENFWPGPLTVVGKMKANLNLEKFFGKTGKVAVRVPYYWWTANLLKEVEYILCSTANKPGYGPPTTLAQTLIRFGRNAELYIDGGETIYGRESTKVDVSEGKLVVLKEGALPANELRQRI
ncbi:MAG: L-threonylcarbamoyladenylate synthase [Nitrososphaeria archaeon]|nr:L-threonylcarbamoyladenylate synthase [Nitrososphaeria archaeon]